MKLFFLFVIFFSVWARATSPCGKEGTIEERIKECKLTKENFVLVARDENGAEIYQDSKTGLIWSDRISTDFNHYGSQKACSGDVGELQIMKDLKWRLPTIREFEEGAAHGMKAAIVRMNYWFWTSTPLKTKKRRRAVIQSYLWDGMGEKADVGDLKDAASVRCVAK